ncbi:hypothetical protein BOX15_Mlig002571g1 [Macrostomum lignano]|uniref:BRO1 domain-containing protein n=1 Tax=Macrostomum lignano TaxID=282301 RepID=A0A267FKQ0_9PLAT|nr:hypothetical protein BOX15_Mlig002571g1 [Macrostomum lignano]
MEGAPRIPMYSFQIKTSSLPIEIDVLKSYLESEYGESASAYDSEFKALLDLRKSALESPQDLGGLSLLKKYYGQLQLLKSRFPMEECEPCALPVSWDDLYIDDVVTHSDIRFEEAAVLYNIGSMESVLGCKQARSDAEGIKAACTHFMSAAWCFQRVSEVFSGAVAPDLESELMRLKAQMMLAQAQECVFRKSQLDGRKSGINARIAQQLVDFYGQLGSMLSSAGTVAKQVIPGRTRKHYSGIFAVKRSFYESQVAYYSAQTAEDTGEYGLRLAWLLKARESLQAAIAANKDLKDSEMRETLKFVQDVIVGKHESAEKDNNLIYHAQIPQTVPEVQSAQLVKPLAFDPAEAAGPDLFKRLVPMKTSEASSVYSEEVSKKLREIGDAVETKDTELAECLSSLQADPEFYSVSEDAPLPQALYDACAQLSVEGDAAQKRLTQRMQQLASAAVDVDTLLGELRQLTKDAPAETAASLRPFLDDLAKFEKVAREAQPSNDSLRASASRHAESLAELRKSPEELKASLPTVTDLQADEQLGQSVSELKRLLGKVSEMRSQRAELLASIRSDLRSEDATSLLLRQPNQDPVQMFEATLAKQQDRLTYLNQNLAAQANILSALIEVHAKLAPHRQLIAQRRADREAALQRLVATWNEGPVLLDKVQEGVDFFTGLHRKLKVIEARLKPLLTPPKPPQPPPQQQQPQPQQPPPPQLHQYSRSSGQFQSLNPTEGQQKRSENEPATLPPAALLASLSGSGGSGGGSNPPRLKDFLPYLKPGTYGSQRSSLPASPHRASAEPVQPPAPQPNQQLPQQYGRHSPLPSSATTGYQQPAPGSGSFDPQQLHQYPTRFPANQFGSQPPPSSTGQFGSQPPPSSTGQFGSQPPTSANQFGSQPPPSSTGQFGSQPPTSANQFGSQPPPTSTGQFGSQPPTSANQFGPQPPQSSTGQFGSQPPTSANQFGSQPSQLSTGQFGSQPPTSTGQFGSQPPTSTAQFASTSARPQQFPTTNAATLGSYSQQPGTSQIRFPQQPGSSSGGFPQQPAASSGGFPQQPAASSGGFPQQPAASSGRFPQQPGTSQIRFPQQPTSYSGIPQQQPGTSQVRLPQQPAGASGGGFPQQQRFPQQPGTSSVNYQPSGSLGGTHPQLPSVSAVRFPQQPVSSATGGFPQQPGSLAGPQQAGTSSVRFPQQQPGFPQQPGFSQQQGSKAGAVPLQPGYSVTGGFAQQPGSATGGYSQQPGSATGGYSQQPGSATGGYSQQPGSATGGYSQQPGSATGGYSQQPVSATGGYSQQPGSATGGYSQQPGSATGGYSQQPGSATGGYSQQPGSSTGNFSQQPGSATSGFSQQPGFATGNFSQQPGSATGNFSQQPGSATGGYSQQPGSATGGHSQQPGSATGGYSQQPGSATGGHSQQPGSATGGYSQQPGSVTSGFSQQPGSVTSGFSQQPGSATGNFSQQPGSATGGYSQQPGSATGNFSQQPASATGNFSQQPASATGNFSQQPASATGNFSQQPGSATGNFSQQPASATGGFPQSGGTSVSQFPSQLPPSSSSAAQQPKPDSRPVRPTVFPAQQKPVAAEPSATDRASSGASTPQHLPPDGAGGGLAKGSNNNSCRSLLDSAARTPRLPLPPC